MFARHCLLCGITVIASLSACKDSVSKDNKKSEATVVAQNEQITETEDALLSKRDALFNMRRELQDKREALAVERAQIQESGGDTSAVDDRAVALMKQEKELVGQEQELNQSMQEILSQRRQIMAALSAGGGSPNDVAGREAGIASREKNVARREQEIAEREASLAKREEGLASKWKDGCALGAPQTIIRTVDVKGSSYTQKDVEPLLAKARKEMSRKGLLASDLPEQVQGLEDEANDAMKSGDFSRARLAASQLIGTVKATRIDKGFIAAKIQRLNSRMRGKTLDKQTEQLFRDATALYGDADFGKANAKLNQIYGSLR